MFSYAKIFSQIFDSTIADDYEVRHVFEDLLKLCDSDGVVNMTPEAISARTRIPLDKILRAIGELEKPDPRSRSTDHNGARIKRLTDTRDWGWWIVNHAHYRGLTSDEMYREKTRERVRKFRGKKPVTLRNATVTSVTTCRGSKQEADAEANTYNKPIRTVAGNGGDFTETTRQLMVCVGQHFKRKPESRWWPEEERLICEVARRDGVMDEWSEILRYRERVRGKVKLRDSIKSVLENWTGEIDKARNYQPTTTGGKPMERSLLQKVSEEGIEAADRLLKRVSQ